MIRYFGDTNIAEALKPVALMEMNKLKRLMSFQKLKQHDRRTVLPDGSIIDCRGFFGNDIINIYGAPAPIEAKVFKPTEYVPWEPWGATINENHTWQYDAYYYQHEDDPPLNTSKFGEFGFGFLDNGILNFYGDCKTYTATPLSYSAFAYADLWHDFSEPYPEYSKFGCKVDSAEILPFMHSEKTVITVIDSESHSFHFFFSMGPYTWPYVQAGEWAYPETTADAREFTRGQPYLMDLSYFPSYSGAVKSVYIWWEIGSIQRINFKIDYIDFI